MSKIKGVLLVSAATAGVLAVVSGIVYVYAQTISLDPSVVELPVTVTGCPEEDSCALDYVIAEYRRITGDASALLSVDYEHGTWTIRKVTP